MIETVVIFFIKTIALIKYSKPILLSYLSFNLSQLQLPAQPLLVALPRALAQDLAGVILEEKFACMMGMHFLLMNYVWLPCRATSL